MPARSIRTGLLLGLGVGVLASAPSQVAAQAAPEPILEQLRSVFDQPGPRIGILLNAVGDPGIDDQTASMRMAAERLRVSGDLDGGWPTSVSVVQVNGIFPLRASALPYRPLVNFQIGF